jgi:hypothetical protein
LDVIANGAEVDRVRLRLELLRLQVLVPKDRNKNIAIPHGQRVEFEVGRVFLRNDRSLDLGLDVYLKRAEVEGVGLAAQVVDVIVDRRIHAQTACDHYRLRLWVVGVVGTGDV